MKEHEENEKLALTDSKEIDKYGIKLTMSYDKETNTFVGTVRNYSTITQKIQIAVRMYVDDKRAPRVWRRLKLKSKEKVQLEVKGVSEKFEYWRLTLYFRE